MIDQIQGAIQRERLLDTAIRLVNIPSPTRSAAEVADCLAQILRDDGFGVERPDAGWPDAPAVVARFESDRPGRTLQFNGHLDTVHLPFVPPGVEDGVMTGSALLLLQGSGMTTAPVALVHGVIAVIFVSAWRRERAVNGEQQPDDVGLE